METVTGAGDVDLAVERTGSGPPLVCVHGTGATRTTWRPLVRRLRDSHDVVTYDRRGRGDSADGDRYDLAAETDDLRAVLAACDETPRLLAHSFGAVVALEALRAADVAALTLYEPPVPDDEYRATLRETRDEMDRLLARGDCGAALATFLRCAGGIADVDREVVGDLDDLDPDRALVETVRREAAAVAEYHLPASLDVTAPALLLRGTESPAYLQSATGRVADSLEAPVAEIEGAGHLGHLTHADAVAAALDR